MGWLYTRFKPRLGTFFFSLFLCCMLSFFFFLFGLNDIQRKWTDEFFCKPVFDVLVDIRKWPSSNFRLVNISLLSNFEIDFLFPLFSCEGFWFCNLNQGFRVYLLVCTAFSPHNITSIVCLCRFVADFITNQFSVEVKNKGLGGGGIAFYLMIIMSLYFEHDVIKNKIMVFNRGHEFHEWKKKKIQNRMISRIFTQEMRIIIFLFFIL